MRNIVAPISTDVNLCYGANPPLGSPNALEPEPQRTHYRKQQALPFVNGNDKVARLVSLDDFFVIDDRFTNKLQLWNSQ